MASNEGRPSPVGLDRHGISPSGNVYWNLTEPKLFEQSVRRREGWVSREGSLVVHTGRYTGRSPNDKFFVREPGSESNIWWGPVNRPFEGDFERLHRRIAEHLSGRDLFVQDLYAGTTAAHRLPVRVVTDSAWHALFARNMLVRPPREELDTFEPSFTLLHAPDFAADPAIDGTNSEAAIVLDMGRRLLLIAGTGYAGEIKKSFFTLMNYLLPLKGVMPMHCSANVGRDGDTALFFGLSGTGKTTLSADPDRRLIGDDEHGWDDDGIFNFEGGCYAKVIRLSREAEPEIYAASHRFGAILENVVIDEETRALDLDDDSLTENTRASYPITHLENIVPEGHAGHPRNIVFLTCDAFGVLPPIARLDRSAAMYHFLAGYTAKVAGTERGIVEPQATFSACFGAPFMPLHPGRYAELLGEKMDRHGTRVWLVNTGWTGGPYGVGSRMKLSLTRAMVRAALAGQLDEIPMRRDERFRVEVPTRCPGVPDDVLDPRATWRDKDAYDEHARKLARMFAEHFEPFRSMVDREVAEAGPAAG
ncbi:MAG: phosphoenolpyruvate carboxykinase (ATP) [Acidobacteria bacterium]|nr:MAG: phosphoenolpyruvate carboxykinase (ATP) [Acidobacteriota bacterium]